MGRQNDAELIRKIKRMAAEGVGKREISRQLECAHSTVVYHTNESNRQKVLAYQRDNTERFRDNRVLTKTQRKKEASEKLLAYLLENPCVDCGNSDPRVLEFDHRDPAEKRANVAEMMRAVYSWEAIREEMAKCDVRCANCHRIRTYEQFGGHRAEWTPEWLTEKGYSVEES